MQDQTIDAAGVRCHVIIDGHRPVSPRFVFKDYDDTVQGPFVRPVLDLEGKLLGRFACLLVDATDGPILVDAGVGRFAPELDAGHTLERLAELSVLPSDVRTVLVTHGHADHVGGLIDAYDAPVFSGARHLIHAREAAFWTSPRALELPGGAGAPAATALATLRAAGLLDVIEGVAEVSPTVRTIEAPGHTPGHIAVVVNDSLLWAGDSIVAPLNVSHPEWVSSADMDGETNAKTRRALLNLAASQGLTLAGPHLQVVGRIHRRGRAYTIE